MLTYGAKQNTTWLPCFTLSFGLEAKTLAFYGLKGNVLASPGLAVKFWPQPRPTDQTFGLGIK